MNLDAMIAEAKAALHRLMTGTQFVRVKIEGEETQFSQTNRAELEGYIARLEAQRDGQATRGAIGFYL